MNETIFSAYIYFTNYFAPVKKKLIKATTNYGLSLNSSKYNALRKIAIYFHKMIPSVATHLFYNFYNYIVFSVVSEFLIIMSS